MLNKTKLFNIFLKLLSKLFKKEMESFKFELMQRAFNDSRKDYEKEIHLKDEERIQQEALKIVDNLLSPVDMTKIVTLDKAQKRLFVGADAVDNMTLHNLISEVDFLEKSEIWKIMHETPKELATRAMFVSGETLADMQKGKSILYMLSVQKNILNTIKGYNK